MAIDDDPEALEVVQQELRDRYGRDYEVICERSPEAAIRTLEQLRDGAEPVAILLADHSMAEMSGAEFLARAHALHPTAKRGLLIEWGERAAAPAILQAMTLGHIDYYLPKPAQVPDERFHRMISEFLDEWTRDFGETFVAVRIIGEEWAPRSHELRDILSRNAVPIEFYGAASEEGKALLREAGLDGSQLPVLLMYTGAVLVDPPFERIAEVFGVTNLPAGTVDVAIVGAGPAGLAAAVYGASEGLATLMLEREALGGQAGSSSLIRNYLGFPRGVSGGDLASRAFEQAWLFGAIPYVTPTVTGIRQADGGFALALDSGRDVAARSVVIATGVSYRRLGIASLEQFMGAGVFYGAAVTEAKAMAGQQVFVAGGGNSAGQAGVHLAKFATRVTILVRGPSLAESMSEYLIQGDRWIAEHRGPLQRGGRGRRRGGEAPSARAEGPEVGGVAERPRERAFRPDRGGAAHRLAPRGHPTRPVGIHPDRDRRRAGREIAVGAEQTTPAARDEHAWCVRGGRRPAWIGEAGGLSGR